jgi:hypothetical protein
MSDIDFLADLPAMQSEHDAWLAVGSELRRLNIDLNSPKAERLARLLEAWGEELATLRAGQDVTLRARVLAEKRQLVEHDRKVKAKGGDPGPRDLHTKDRRAAGYIPHGKRNG